MSCSSLDLSCTGGGGGGGGGELPPQLYRSASTPYPSLERLSSSSSSSAESSTKSCGGGSELSCSSSISSEERAAFVARFNVPSNLVSVLSPLVESLQYNQFCLAYTAVSLAGEKKKSKAHKAVLDCFVQPTLVQFRSLIETMVDIEVDKCTGHEELLFRDNASFSTRFLDLLLQRYGREYIKKVIGSVKCKFKGDQLEVNPSKEANTEIITQNAKNLMLVISKIFQKLFASTKKFPPTIAFIIDLLSARLMGSGSVRTAMSTILFLKLLCPAICEGVISISKSTTQQRVSIAKILQAVANGTSFDDSNYLSIVNPELCQFEREYLVFCTTAIERANSAKALFTPPSQRTIITEWLELINFIRKNKADFESSCTTTSGDGEALPNTILLKQLDKSLAIATKGLPIFLLHLSNLE